METGANIVRRYAKSEPVERIDIICAHYENFTDSIRVSAVYTLLGIVSMQVSGTLQKEDCPEDVINHDQVIFWKCTEFLSTILFLVFVVFFIKTMKKTDGEKKWKKAAIITVLMGTPMSALSGCKKQVKPGSCVFSVVARFFDALRTFCESFQKPIDLELTPSSILCVIQAEAQGGDARYDDKGSL